MSNEHGYRWHGASSEDVVDPHSMGESEVHVVLPSSEEVETVDPGYRSLEQQRLLDARAAFEGARAKLREATKEVLSLWVKYHGTFLFLDDEDMSQFPNNYSRQLKVLDERIMREGGSAAEATSEDTDTNGVFRLLRNVYERGRKSLGADTPVVEAENAIVIELKKEQAAVVSRYNEIQTAFSIARRKLDAAITHYARLNKNTGEFLKEKLDPSVRFEKQVPYNIQPLYKSSYTMVDLRGFLEANNMPVPALVERYDDIAAK